MAGKLITFEGIEGSGKSTQVERLAAHLRRRGFDPLVTREPGGTPLGDRIRRQLLDPSDPVPIDPGAELLLFLAARLQHLRAALKPALEAGRPVICDRFRDATMAYQGDGRGLSQKRIAALEETAGIALRPDLTLLLDLEVEPALARIGTRADGGGETTRFDDEAAAFHQRVRQGYLRIAAAEPDRVRRIDAARPPATVATEVAEFVDTMFDAARDTTEGS